MATLLDAWSVFVNSNGNWQDVTGVWGTTTGHYLFEVSPGHRGDFSIFQFIESKYRLQTSKITSLTAKTLFAEGVSRGVYSEVNIPLDEVQTGVIGDGPLGSGVVHKLRHSNSGQILVVTSEFSVGRSRSRNNYAIPENTGVSRSHFELNVKSGKLVIRDLESTNGTKVNQRLLTVGEQRELYSGDIVSACEETFEVLA